MSRFARSALIAFLVLQTACGTTPPAVLGTEQREGLGRVAVLASGESPELRFDGFPHGKGEGAAAGGSGTFLACAGALGQGSCSGALCGPVAVLWLGICGVAGIAGGIVGAVRAPTAHAVTSAETTMTAALSDATIQRALRDQLRAALLTSDVDLVPVDDPLEARTVEADDFRTLSTTADTVLIVGLTEARTTATGAGTLSLQATAHARLVRSRDNAELFRADYRFNGEAHSLEDWTAHQGQRLLAGLRDIYERLGAHIFDSVFLLYPFPDRTPHSAGILASAFGLAPIDPPTRGQLTGDKLFGERIEWKTVTSRRPRLRWEAFPRQGDREKAPGDMAQVHNVRYDLVIARERDLAPAEIVYMRTGLPTPAHRLETALDGDAHYFWSVRARFELQGRERVTEWSATAAVADQGLTVPSRWSYRFRTP